MGEIVEIVAATERWAAEFDQIGRALRQALGDLALRIDHIGSTSVPGLVAKDVIDVQVTVAALDPAEPLRGAMATLGYVERDIFRDHAPPGTPATDTEWAKRYFSAGAGQRRTHIHVRAAGRANQRYALLFRDYLRAHPASAAAYATLKQRLAAQVAADREAYVTIKDPVCDLIWIAAEAWAEHRGWTPGPSDA